MRNRVMKRSQEVSLTFWLCLRCGHVSEETKSADWASAWGILITVFLSIVLGFGYCVALLFSIQVPSRHFFIHRCCVVHTTCHERLFILTWACSLRVLSTHVHNL